MAAKDLLGRAGEDRAARYLQSLGYALLDRNWRTRDGELDLVMTREGELIVVEVKTRSSEGFGHPLEAVDSRKQARLWRLAMAWIAAHPAAAQGRRLRIDAIAITGRDPASAALEHLEDLR